MGALGINEQSELAAVSLFHPTSARQQQKVLNSLP